MIQNDGVVVVELSPTVVLIDVNCDPLDRQPG